MEQYNIKINTTDNLTNTKVYVFFVDQKIGE